MTLYALALIDYVLAVLWVVVHVLGTAQASGETDDEGIPW